MEATNILSQAELLEKIKPWFEKSGKLYRKNRKVLARPAKTGEQIVTVTSDGAETKNEADHGDFVVQNQTSAKEQYLVSAHKFKVKYKFLGHADGDFKEYESLGQIKALELRPEILEACGLPDEFYFMATWDEKMIARSGDFLGGPEKGTEVYRIARKEFFETYAEIE